MGNNKECPNTEKCPIFNGFLEPKYIDTYKNLYCLAGEEGRNKCKRYIVSLRVGKCPKTILPNSSKSIEEIIEEMKQSGDLN
ncbi:MAG: hypothetical protein JXB49_29070 [Bacteroidales bacterium]|nr:hypothetical protein [Bacteroidales bacterium]